MSGGKSGFQPTDIIQAPTGTTGVVGVVPGMGSDPSSPTWFSKNGANLAKGAGKGLLDSMQTSQQQQPHGGAASSPMQIPQTPNINTGWDPNYLLKLMGSRSGGTNSSSNFFGG